ncbi:hypothetical protein JCM5353_000253, partial [Sporobolomyces roseus]
AEIAPTLVDVESTLLRLFCQLPHVPLPYDNLHNPLFRFHAYSLVSQDPSIPNIWQPVKTSMTHIVVALMWGFGLAIATSAARQHAALGPVPPIPELERLTAWCKAPWGFESNTAFLHVSQCYGPLRAAQDGNVTVKVTWHAPAEDGSYSADVGDRTISSTMVTNTIEAMLSRLRVLTEIISSTCNLPELDLGSTRDNWQGPGPIVELQNLDDNKSKLFKHYNDGKSDPPLYDKDPRGELLFNRSVAKSILATAGEFEHVNANLVQFTGGLPPRALTLLLTPVISTAQTDRGVFLYDTILALVSKYAKTDPLSTVMKPTVRFLLEEHSAIFVHWLVYIRPFTSL